MTKEEAEALAASGFWEHLSHEDRARFQWRERRLCMPFQVFHEAMEKTLGRPIWTHEFALNREGLEHELFEGGKAPTMQQIIDMIPPEKRVVINFGHGQGGEA